MHCMSTRCQWLGLRARRRTIMPAWATPVAAGAGLLQDRRHTLLADSTLLKVLVNSIRPISNPVRPSALRHTQGKYLAEDPAPIMSRQAFLLAVCSIQLAAALQVQPPTVRERPTLLGHQEVRRIPAVDMPKPLQAEATSVPADTKDLIPIF